MTSIDQATFLSQVAHETRTPMHVMGAALSEILSELEFAPYSNKTDELRGWLDGVRARVFTAEEQIARLNRRITEMLEAAYRA